MAVRKRPAAAVDRQGAHASFRGKRRVVVARRTCPGHITIKKTAAAATYHTTAAYDEVEDTPSPCLVEAATGAVNKTPHRPMGHTAVAINFPSSLPPPELAQEQLLLVEAACPHVGADAGTAKQAARAVPGPGGDAVSEEGLQVLIERATHLTCNPD